MCLQIIGKVKLALAHSKPSWTGAPLHVTARGLTTGPMPYAHGAVEVFVDLIGGEVVIETSMGDRGAIALTTGPCVSDLFHSIAMMLRRFDVRVDLWTKPQEVADVTPLDQNQQLCTYDAQPVVAMHRALSLMSVVFDEWRSGFFGRTSLQFWWGGFDLSSGIFNGERCERPTDLGYIMEWDFDAQVVSPGWWPGNEKHPEPAFYAYAYPHPPGYEEQPVAPTGAHWSGELGEFVLPYAIVAESSDPRAALLEFLESTYTVGARGLGWDLEALRHEPPPPSPNLPADGTGIVHT